MNSANIQCCAVSKFLSDYFYFYLSKKIPTYLYFYLSILSAITLPNTANITDCEWSWKLLHLFEAL